MARNSLNFNLHEPTLTKLIGQKCDFVVVIVVIFVNMPLLLTNYAGDESAYKEDQRTESTTSFIAYVCYAHLG